MNELDKVMEEIEHIVISDLSITYKQFQILELIAVKQAKIIDLLNQE